MLRSRFLGKLYAGFVGVILFTTLVIGLLIAHRVETDLTDQIRTTLESQGIILRELVAPVMRDSSTVELERIVNHLAKETDARITVIRADGVVLADSDEDPQYMDNHLDRMEIQQALVEGVGTSNRYSGTLQTEMMYLALPVGGRDAPTGFVRTSIPLTRVESRLTRMRVIIAAGAAGAGLIALILGFFFARRITNPLERMTSAAHAIARGDYEQRIHHNRSDEIGNLADTLNTMTGQLRERIETITADRTKLMTILAGMVEGVIAVDAEERIIHVNSAAAGILNTPVDQSIGKRIWEATRNTEVCESLYRAMEDRQATIGEIRLPATGGKDQVIQLHAAPLRDSAGDVEGAIVVLHDVSELRKLEEVRRDFIANISHELKTPLAAIRGLVETLIDDGEMTPETHDRFLQKIQKQTSRLANLVTDLLALSRLESDTARTESSELDLREPVSESIRALMPYGEGKQLEFAYEMEDEPVTVTGDSEALREMTDNLINNAIKYSSPGGKVDVRLRVDGRSAVLEVEDTGIGIAAEDQNRVFERFYRVDKARSRELGGTGLGLAIVKHVTLSHGGNVSLRSTLGEGSTFRVQLPLSNSN